MTWLQRAFAVAVLLVWTGTFGKYLVAGGDAPPDVLSGVMLAVVTAVFGADARRLIQKARGNGDRTNGT